MSGYFTVISLAVYLNVKQLILATVSRIDARAKVMQAV